MLGETGLLSSSGKQFIRELREHIESIIIELTHVMFFWIPDDEGKGEALRMLHTCLPLIVMLPFFLVANTNPLRLFIFLFVCAVVATQCVFNGCLITRAERRLTKKKTTVIDLFINATGSEINRDTLTVATLSSGFTAVFIMMLALIGDVILILQRK